MSNKKEAEDVVIEFENQSEEQFLLYFHDSNNWCIENKCAYHPLAFFNQKVDAEACAETLKRSV